MITLANCQIYPRELDSLNYFPHAVGNVWQFMYDDGRLFQEKIIQDSIDNYGNTFLNYGPTLPMFHWSYKINAEKDSVFYLPFAINHLQYKFPLDSGDIFVRDTASTFYGLINDTYDIIIFENFTNAITISYYVGHPDSFGSGWMYTQIIANNYGKIWYGDEVEYMTLIGCVIDGDTSGIIFTDVEDINPQILPDNSKLYQNFPNPFNPVTTIQYAVKERGLVSLLVYDMLGRMIAKLVSESKYAGSYSVSFDASNLPSGVYIYTLRVNDFAASKKMIVVK